MLVTLRLIDARSNRTENVVAADMPAGAGAIGDAVRKLVGQLLAGPVTPARTDVAAVGVGQLYVETDPPGAFVYVDGQERGQTPTLLAGVPAGWRNLLLRLDGYELLKKRVEISRDGRKEIREPLMPQYGALSITSEPPGATCTIDDVIVRRLTATTRRSASLGELGCARPASLYTASSVLGTLPVFAGRTLAVTRRSLWRVRATGA